MQLGAPSARLQAALADVSAVLERHRVLEDFTSRQQTTRRDLLEHLQHQQNLVELQTRCQRLHPADLAFILESLAYDDRALVWNQLAPAARGAALAESSDVVRAWLIEQTRSDELAVALQTLDAESLAEFETVILPELWQRVSMSLDQGDLTRLLDADAYPADSVGSRIFRDAATVRETMTVGDALQALRERPALPSHLDQLCVVDARNTLRGVVPVSAVLTSSADTPMARLMQTDPVVFAADESMDDAAKAFERYHLVSAPVINAHGKLLGRITSDVVIDHIRATSDRAALQNAGLEREEDLFAPVFDSARNRWPWLAINLLTAFFASRVIGVFEDAIDQLVALATLMPIVASIGGNTGNHTVALVIRGLALDHLHPGSFGQPPGTAGCERLTFEETGEHITVHVWQPEIVSLAGGRTCHGEECTHPGVARGGVGHRVAELTGTGRSCNIGPRGPLPVPAERLRARALHAERHARVEQLLARRRFRGEREHGIGPIGRQHRVERLAAVHAIHDVERAGVRQLQVHIRASCRTCEVRGEILEFRPGQHAQHVRPFVRRCRRRTRLAASTGRTHRGDRRHERGPSGEVPPRHHSSTSPSPAAMARTPSSARTRST